MKNSDVKRNKKHLLDPELSLRLGREIRRRRTASGLSVAELARSSSLTASYLSDLERGKGCRNPSIGTLLSIAQGLGIDIADLFGSKRRKMSAIGQEGGLLLEAIAPPMQEALLCIMRALRSLPSQPPK